MNSQIPNWPIFSFNVRKSNCSKNRTPKPNEMGTKYKCYQARGQTMNTVSVATCSIGACIYRSNMDCTTSTQSHDATAYETTWNHASDLGTDTHRRLCLSLLKNKSAFAILKWSHWMKTFYSNSIACDRIKLPTKFLAINKGRVRPTYFRNLKTFNSEKNISART
jgi:hypothetical protein